MEFSGIKYLLGISLALFSCTEPEKKTVSRIDSLVSLPIPLDTVNQKIVKKDSIEKDTTPSYFKFEGTVSYNRKYCGGARPTDEILAEYAKEKPFTNSTFKLQEGSRTYFVTTDDKGDFSVNIPHGNYEFYLTTKLNKKIYILDQKKCAWCLTMPIAPVYFSRNKKQKINFTIPCDPRAELRP